MTITPVPTDPALAASAALSAAENLPSVQPLVPSGPRPGADLDPSPFRAAVVARVAGRPASRIVVLVGAELVQALSSSPHGELVLAAATQPALDAAAAALGVTAEMGEEQDLALALGELGHEVTAVTLLGAATAAALVLTDDLLATAASESRPGFEPLGSLPGGATASASGSRPLSRGIEMLHGVDMELTVELGRTRMAVRDLLALAPGDVLELDRAAGSPADLLVNGRLIARGEVVVVDENFGLRISQILDAEAG